MKLLSDEEIENRLPEISGWIYEFGSISKNFVLKDFSAAIALVVKIGIEAEKNDHHPDLLVHGWNKLRVTISTHSLGGVTDEDFKLAIQIERLL